MNNSIIQPHAKLDTTPQVEHKAKLVRMIEAIQEVVNTTGWKVLKQEIFDELVKTLERRIMSESKKPKIEPEELYRLQGQLAWARKYSKLEDLAEVFKVGLTNINKQHEDD